MRQLTQWRPHYEAFKNADTEVICIFREEKEGQEGLRRSREATKTTLPLALDLEAKLTPTYQKYNAYLVDKQGRVRAILAGTKTKRATAESMLEEIQKLESATESGDAK